ncbi:MAG: hypothetical protein K6G23_09745 [Lachnospiraceae bacterium]|nr:hypothetical protein [Lachnospiraceae bacterium]
MKTQLACMEQTLKHFGVSEMEYEIGKSAEAKSCIVDEDQGYSVFFMIKGQRINEANFTSADEACLYMIDGLSKSTYQSRQMQQYWQCRCLAEE